MQNETNINHNENYYKISFSLLSKTIYVMSGKLYFSLTELE